MVASKYEEVRPITVRVSLGEDGTMQLSGDKITAMDKRYSVGDRIYLKKSKEGLIFQSYRGNMSQEWDNITPKWYKYSVLLAKGKLPEELEQLLKEDENIETTAPAVAPTDALSTVFSEVSVNSDTTVKEEIIPTVNTNMSAIPDGQGLKELKKKAKRGSNLQKSKESAKKLADKIQGDKSGVVITDDTDTQKLKRYQEEPIYRSVRNSDGSFTIAKSQIHRHKYEIRVCGELNSTTFTTSVKVFLVDCYNGKENIGACKSIPTRSIRQGGTNLINLIMDFGNIFTMAEANYANGRLFVLIMSGQMTMQDLDNCYSFSQTVDWFREYITKGLTERAKSIDNKGLWHPEIYLEEISHGPRSELRGKHIVCGIWQSDFKKLYKSLVDEGKVIIKEAEFLKQGKQQHILLPDAGRGGGQHTPGEPTCLRYGRSSTERIQRFCFDRRSLQVMWNTETVFRLLGGGTYC